MEHEEYDEVVVIRALEGDKSVLEGKRYLIAERTEIVRRALLRGWSQQEIVRRTGIARPDRYMTPKEEVG